MAVWSPEAVAEFIRLYREHPCLWKIKSKDYSNRGLRNMAYDELVEFCKEIGFGSANREFVFKKIQNLRGAFRKELKKVTDARDKNNDVYKPNLWYFDLLLFTKDQELPSQGVSNLEESSLEGEPLEPVVSVTWVPQQQQQQQPAGVTSPPHEPSDVDVSSPLLDPAHALVDENKPRRGVKRKRSDFDPQMKLMSVCLEALKRKEMTEFDGFAVCVAKKLEKMDSVQALYAETLIHSVLRRGIFNQLTESTDICDLQCSKTLHYSSSTGTANTSRQLSSTPAGAEATLGISHIKQEVLLSDT